MQRPTLRPTPRGNHRVAAREPAVPFFGLAPGFTKLSLAPGFTKLSVFADTKYMTCYSRSS
ncbi:hypothetical protein [Lentzea guizhouensis]|uniref:hypothetical protein n=1 Tax=Lentzea guizhouensis TaxID=1586287 RepID=UPI0014743E3B|nr:hypothetical protein [Lentzea guizhouensis]